MTDAELEKECMCIINQLFDLAEISVEKRQQINDCATDYLIKQVKRLIVNDPEYDPHEVSKVKCDLCNYGWIAVRPLGTEKLECPNCNNLTNFENQ